MLKINFCPGRVISFILSVLLCLICFSSCSGSSTKTDNVDTITFTDALNRKVTVAKKPKRVAALLGSFADMWLLSGGNICATSEDAWDDFGLELPDAVNIGGAHSPNLEVLLASDPDFVIASASTASNIEMKDVLENAGICVAYFDVDCFEDYLSMLDICTDITTRKDLFTKNGLDIKTKIDDIKSKVSDASLDKTQKTVLLLRASSGFVKAKGSNGTILGEMLCELGCVNIADSDKSLLETLSVESIISYDPYHIFVVTMGDDTKKATDNLYSVINENPALSNLQAVKQSRVHIMDKKLFNIKPNSNWAIAYEKLSNILLDKKE